MKILKKVKLTKHFFENACAASSYCYRDKDGFFIASERIENLLGLPVIPTGASIEIEVMGVTITEELNERQTLITKAVVNQ